MKSNYDKSDCISKAQSIDLYLSEQEYVTSIHCVLYHTYGICSHRFSLLPKSHSVYSTCSNIKLLSDVILVNSLSEIACTENTFY